MSLHFIDIREAATTDTVLKICILVQEEGVHEVPPFTSLSNENSGGEVKFN